MYHFELQPTRYFFNREEYFAPACEIVDEEKSYAISLDIPGMKEDDLDIEVKDNQLYVSGERRSLGQDNILRTERKYGKFERIFKLPQNVNADAIEARFVNGVLDIVLPKEEKSLSRKITINGGLKN